MSSPTGSKTCRICSTIWGEEDGLVPQSGRGDEARASGPPDPRGGPSRTRRQAARHPRDQAKVLIQSRDFH